jgi:subtilisin-like proprotein convertase family protein
MLKERNDARLNALTDFRFVRAEADGRVAVDIALTDASGIKPVMNRIESLGGELKDRSERYLTIRARVRLQDLEALAAIPQVRKVRNATKAMTHVDNVSEGDKTHGAEGARGFFGTTGSGVKVGVLSDGVDSLAAVQASGDLPAVEVLPGQAGGGDEGTAMLEIVHDLAPGAQLAFATAFTSEASFAQNILDLAAAGCNVIVDDVIYLDESPFQDGPVAQAVNTVTAAGVIYFSSAGNEGNVNDGTSGTWEGDFLTSAQPNPGPLTGAGPLHDFGDGGNSILVTLGAPVNVLIWAEHYDLSTGNASTDLDLFNMNGALTTIFDASTDVQDGAGGDDFAFEATGASFSGERFVINRFADGTTTSDPMFNFIAFRGELDPMRTTPGATRGHSAAADAFSTAATPAAESFDGVTPDGPYPGLFTSANESESFTADGPRRIILSPTGVELTPGNRTATGGVVRQKPDITAADGVSCAAPGFNPFYGTSAAAPHAAAIAALIKSAVPAITPAQLRTALVTSAIDIETPGLDRDTGAGIVMAHEALVAAGAQPAAFLSLDPVVPTEDLGDGDASIESNEIWELLVPVTNDGGLAGTAISAVLTSPTAGVTILQGNSTYPDLDPAESGSNAALFRFALADDFECGNPIEFDLTVTLTGGPNPTQDLSFDLPTGEAGTPMSFSYTGPPVPIPDAPGPAAIANLLVSGVNANIAKVTLKIDGATCNATAGSTTVGIDHTFVNDLKITLRSPSGATVLVINNTDGGGNNFCQTLLDDDSAGPSIQTVVTANAPFTGSFKPNAPLSGLDGGSADGTWQLEVQDFAGIDIGNIRAFTLEITPAVCNSTPHEMTPSRLLVDEHAAPGTVSNMNGVWEPGETVLVEPVWIKGGVPQVVTGIGSGITGPAGGVYTMPDTSADYGMVDPFDPTDCFGEGGCYQASVDDPAVRPAAPWSASFLETLSAGPTKTWNLHIGDSFLDAPPGSFGYRFIETIFKNGVTSGCGAGNYCPGGNVLREQMSVFLLVSEEGAGYVPPDCVTPMFGDVPCSNPFSKWINELANPARAITSGCGGGNYCPADPVTREQMSVFLLRTEGGATYTPADCVTPIFDDVPCSNNFSKWINELYNRGITSGCSVTPALFCPATPVTRAQMSVFLTATFGLTLYGP